MHGSISAWGLPISAWVNTDAHAGVKPWRHWADGTRHCRYMSSTQGSTPRTSSSAKRSRGRGVTPLEQQQQLRRSQRRRDPQLPQHKSDRRTCFELSN